MIKELTRRALIVLFCLATTIAAAQEEPPGDPNEDPQVPISGIWLLLAGGAAYGGKKVYDFYRRK